MRVNVYAEEMPDNPAQAIEIFEKVIEGHTFTGLRIYLELPVTKWVDGSPDPVTAENTKGVSQETFDVSVDQHKGRFIHRPGDDDSSAITFWGKRDLRGILEEALRQLNEHYANKALQYGGDTMQQFGTKGEEH